jgi:hypothetical protein
LCQRRINEGRKSADDIEALGPRRQTCDFFNMG